MVAMETVKCTLNERNQIFVGNHIEGKGSLVSMKVNVLVISRQTREAYNRIKVSGREDVLVLQKIKK